MTATPDKDPPRSRAASSEALLCRKDGSCSSNNPNIDSARTTKIRAKAPSTQAFCKAPETMVPDSPAATPAAA